MLINKYQGNGASFRPRRFNNNDRDLVNERIRFKEVLLKEAAARPEGLPLETALLQRCRDYFEDNADEVLAGRVDDVDDVLHGRLVVGQRRLDLLLAVRRDRLVAHERAVDADALAVALGVHLAGVDVEELEFERGGTCVDNEDVHGNSFSRETCQLDNDTAKQPPEQGREATSR